MNLAVAFQNRVSGERASNLRRSIDCHEAALTIYTEEAFPEKHARTMHNLGQVYFIGGSQEDLDKAIACGRKAISIRQAIGGPELVDSLHNLGISEAKAGQFESASATFEDAFTMLVQLRKDAGRGLLHARHLGDKFSGIFDAAVLCELLSPRGPEGALFWSERGRAQVLAESLRQQYDYAECLPEETRREYQSTLGTVRQLHAEMDRLTPGSTESIQLQDSLKTLEEKLDDMEDAARSTESWLESGIGDTAEVALEDVYTSLSDDTVAMSFYFGPVDRDGERIRLTDGLHVFGIFHGTLVHRSTTKLREPSEKVGRVLFENTQCSPEVQVLEHSYLDRVGRLMSSVLADLADATGTTVDSANKIVVIPHRGMQRMPFAAITVHSPDGVPKRVGERFPGGLYLAPSLSIYVHVALRYPGSFGNETFLSQGSRVVQVVGSGSLPIAHTMCETLREHATDDGVVWNGAGKSWTPAKAQSGCSARAGRSTSVPRAAYDNARWPNCAVNVGRVYFDRDDFKLANNSKATPGTVSFGLHRGLLWWGRISDFSRGRESEYCNIVYGCWCTTRNLQPLAGRGVNCVVDHREIF